MSMPARQSPPWIRAPQPDSRLSTADPQAAPPPVTVGALPPVVNLVLYQGDDFRFNLVLTNPDQTPADLTGATATAQIRASSSSPDPPTATFTCTVATDTVSLHLAAADSASLVGPHVWDCQLTSASGDITTLVAGSVTITAEVTRP